MAWQNRPQFGGHPGVGEPPLGCVPALPAVQLVHISDASDHFFPFRHRHSVQLVDDDLRRQRRYLNARTGVAAVCALVITIPKGSGQVRCFQLVHAIPPGALPVDRTNQAANDPVPPGNSIASLACRFG